MNLNKLKQDNATRWRNCHIPADKAAAFKKVADVLLQNKQHYQVVEKQLNDMGFDVPWYVIAVAHYREAGFDKNGQPRWDTYLGNGELLDRKTVLIPKGRGPFKTWEDGACDALVYAPPYAAKNTDWSIGGTLTMLEEYNGLGYANMDKPSPYLWAGSDQYSKGKYIADGKYSATTVDQQLGCAGILKFMGVFKTAPTGAGTQVAATAVVISTAAVATHAPNWQYVLAHWPVAVGIVVGLGVLADFALFFYNRHKNKLKVS